MARATTTERFVEKLKEPRYRKSFLERLRGRSKTTRILNLMAAVRLVSEYQGKVTDLKDQRHERDEKLESLREEVSQLRDENRRLKRHVDDEYLDEEEEPFCADGEPTLEETMRQVVEYVRDHPGCPMTELVQNIEHHYNGDPSSSIMQHCRQGRLEDTVEVKMKKGQSYLRLYD